MASIAAWHGETLSGHTKLRDDAAKQGYRYLSLSIYGSISSPVYAAVMIKRPKVVAQRDWPLLTADEFQQVFEDQAQKGYGPVIIAATGSSSNPRFAAVFQPQGQIPLTRHRLRSGASDDLNTIQGMNRKAKIDRLILRWAACYGGAADPRFAAIWVPNPGKVTWNADGVSETGDQYQARFNAQTSGWCRPSFVTSQKDGRYFSLFVDNEIGPWVARHGITPSEYQQQFDDLTPKGYFPICVQAAGTSASNARFTTIFVKREELTAREWNATGPTANTDIDNVIKEIMQATPVRHAALAIVKGKKLVYARAYAWAEPDWPVVQPTSRFRIASVSKTITALAIYQLIEKKVLHLTDKVQDILQLKTPSGGPPMDPRFKDVTIRHLLEHTSSINANDYRNDILVLDAHKQANPNASWSLPVTAAMTDAYIASLNMGQENPGVAQAYNNCGYYLLGRVLAKKWGTTAPIDALQLHLFDPLDITRIRRARSLLKNQPADEARYRMSVVGKGDEARLDIAILQSVMTNDRPLVPVGYGHEQYEKQEGSGGLSAAVTDLARVIAVLISQSDNPAMKRSTITTMLSNAVAAGAKFGKRAGHGLDGAADLGGGKYYGQKGGSLETSGNVLEFNGNWGFVMCWAGKLIADYQGQGWYPDFDPVMSIAKSVSWGSTNLFPQYGMPPF
jgi:CubicO group peptidase (beta-lactamase class C family)